MDNIKLNLLLQTRDHYLVILRYELHSLLRTLLWLECIKAIKALFLYLKIPFIIKYSRGKRPTSIFLWCLTYRLGWYATTHIIDDLWRQGIIADHWRSLFSKSVAEKFALADQFEVLQNLTVINTTNHKHYCDSPFCEEGIYYGYGCPRTNFSKCSTLIASFPSKLTYV